MSSISLSTALSGMSAASERLRASAHNTANLQTENFKPERVEQSTLPDDNGVRTQTLQTQQAEVSAEREVVAQRDATYTFIANLRVLQTQVRAEGALLDIEA